ncbi:carbohydrate ABC transporter permease [Phytohabitans kaempferiae]|uniref:Carbohydrate ABC transporter permease n=1 Tax=Phytohabitans kaempferiae TaxID=1620943 RepID=A0ABV6M9P3_9ACTN
MRTGNRLAVALSVAPGVALFATFYVVAIGLLAGTAFTDWSVRDTRFVGLDNFAQIAQDPRFWIAVRNTVIFTAASVFVTVPIAVLVALILARRIRGWRSIRLALFLPYMVPGAATAYIFVVIFNARFGLLNSLLRAIGLDGLTRDWLYDVDTALVAVILTGLFNIGFYTILILAEAQSIPREYYEAAELDGAGLGRREWRITIPLTRHVIATCCLLAALGALNAFEGVYVLTRGGPADETMTLGLYGYLAYTRGDWGMANAVGLVTLVAGVGIVLLVRRLGRIEESDR